METVLEIYHEPYDETRPVICFDESSKALRGQERDPLPAEIEIGVLKRQCLDRRIYDVATLRAEVAAWQQRRNETNHQIDWQFTTHDARIKLRQLYPVEPDEDLHIQRRIHP